MSYGAGYSGGALNPNTGASAIVEKAPRQVSLIESALQTMDQRLDHLAKIQSVMRERLDPVLGPALPHTKEGSGGIVNGSAVNVAERLTYLAARLEAITNGFTEQLDRLEV